MDKIKLYLVDIMNSNLVKHCKEILMPTFSELKSKGVVKIVLLALSLTILLIPFNFGMSLLRKLFGGFLSFSFGSGISPITIVQSLISTMRYASGIELITIIGFAIVSSIISIIYFLATNFYLPNGALNSFKIYLEENRVVTAKEYIKLSKTNVKRYASEYILKVLIPIMLIGFVGGILAKVPYVSGRSMATMITSILKYALLFKMYADLLGLNGEEEMYKHSEKWIVYSVFMYILARMTSLGLIISLFNTLYILFVLKNILNISETNSLIKEDIFYESKSENINDEFAFESFDTYKNVDYNSNNEESPKRQYDIEDDFIFGL